MSALGRQFHPMYRGIHMDITPDTSEDEILSKVKRRPPPMADEDFERQRLAEDPDTVDRWPVYGNNWTTHEDTAKTFALRKGHNMGYTPKPDARERTGLILEAHSKIEPKHNPLMKGYGEMQVDWPGRSNIEGFTAHVVHDVGGAARSKYTRETHGSSRAALDAFDADRERIVRSFPIPEDHWRPEWAR